MVLLAAFQSTSNAAAAAAAPAAFFGFFALIWCSAISLVLAQFGLLIAALIQILSRKMPNDAKILWAAVAWVVPIVGPILWWTIGSKQNPPIPPSGPGSQL